MSHGETSLDPRQGAHQLVDEIQLEALEEFLSQSLKGHHHLFDQDRIKQILKVPTEDADFFTVENMEKIQGFIIELMKRQSLQEKRRYLQSLSTESYEMVVRAYFHIVDSTLQTSSLAFH
jgi:hypothetical protein